ncbi:MAG: hypothetical protein DMG05_30870 [Acidobacteria bacterium]|nr:MAG: hypothetical protein DMG05_30870 [Acidobacteriota bacterium]
MQRVFSELAWRGSWQVKIYSQIMEGPDGACISQGTSGKKINDANLSSGTKAKRARTGARRGLRGNANTIPKIHPHVAPRKPPASITATPAVLAQDGSDKPPIGSNRLTAWATEPHNRTKPAI